MDRRSFLWFFLLACALSWWPSLYEAHGILPLGPLLAALFMLALTAGWSGVKDFLKRIVRWRVAPQWYLLVLGLPLTLTAGASALTARLSGSAPSWDRMPALSERTGDVRVHFPHHRTG